MPRPALSIAMIVRDEAAMLPEFLARAAPHADEIVVVDTGSRDGTVDIAAAAGCVVAHFAWRDDFSAARNASLDRCTGDWVFVLDADERLDAAGWAAVRALTAGPANACYRFITRNYTHAAHLAEFVHCAPDDPHARGFAGWYPSGKVRLFPNRAGACFEGEVHELVNASLEARGFEVRTADAPIHHYPLLKPEAALQAKRAHYLALGRAKAAARPGEVQPQLELGAQYLETGDYANALRCYQAALRIEPAHPVALKDLGAVLHLLGRNGAARQALELAVRAAPDAPDAWRNLGVVLAAQGDWTEAAGAFARAVAKAPGRGEPLRLLALARLEAGQTVEAEAPARAAARALPFSGQAVDLYAAVMERLGRGEEAHAFLESLGTPEARAAADRLRRGADQD